MAFIKRDPKKFWKWFLKHENEFLTVDEDNLDRMYDKMYKFIQFYNAFIEVEFNPRKIDNKLELTFSANGNTLIFDAVFSLVESAPADLLKRWHIHALRQPRVNEIILHFETKTVNSKEILYELATSENDDSKFDIFINIKGIVYDSEELEDYVAHTMIAVIEGVIGEYLCATKIDELILVDDGELKDPKSIISLIKDIKD